MFNAAEHLTEASAKCVHFLDPLRAALVENDLARVNVLVRTLAPDGIITDADVRERITELFAFPASHRGGGAEDGLKDLSWLPAPAYVLRVPDSGGLWRTVPHAAGELVQRWLSAAHHWAARDVAFHLLFLPHPSITGAVETQADPRRALRTVHPSFAQPSPRCVHFLTSAQAAYPDQDSDGDQVLVVTLDGHAVHSDADLLATMGALFKLPAAYDGTYEDLRWLLSDLHWLDAPGYVLRVEHADALWRQAAHAAGALTEVWLTAAEFWHYYQTPFHLQFVLDS